MSIGLLHKCSCRCVISSGVCAAPLTFAPVSRCFDANASVWSSGAAGDAAILVVQSDAEASPMFWENGFSLLSTCCLAAASCVVWYVVLWALYEILLRFHRVLGSSPLLVVGSPPVFWDQALFSFEHCLLQSLLSFPCCCGVGLLGCYCSAPPCTACGILMLLCCCWSSPGCFQDHCEMFQAPVVSAQLWQWQLLLYTTPSVVCTVASYSVASYSTGCLKGNSGSRPDVEPM